MVMRTPVLKSIILFPLFAGCCLSAKAQADVDSPYSLFGIGQVNNGGMNVRLKGMGGTANAMFGGGLINSVNPASYGKIDSLAFLFDAGFYFKSSTFSTSSLSENASNASFDQVALCFGATDWWKMAIGVQPFTTSGYTMLVDDVKPGVGKTTTVAKLAAKFITEKKKRVGFLTADTYRIAATEKLKTYADIIGSPLSIVYSVEDMAGELSALGAEASRQST